MRAWRFTILLVPLLLGSCADDPPIAACEKQLKFKLKAPSTYKRVAASRQSINAQNPSDAGHPNEEWVTIEYDAVNAFNAPIRDTEICRYRLESGKPDLNAQSNTALPEPAMDASGNVVWETQLNSN